ncbi:MAG: hypothetical protein CME68_03405 [Halobacteriovoraceae bacterium]|nr:hypothetical protein [Halobacteriovoraceae bacterium]
MRHTRFEKVILKFKKLKKVIFFIVLLPLFFSPYLSSQELLDAFNKNAGVVVKTLEAVSKQQDEQYKLMQLKMQQASLQSYLTPRVQPLPNQVFPNCMRPLQTTTPPSCMVNDSQGLAMAQMIINASYQHQSTYAQNLSEENEQTGLGCLKKSRETQKSFIKDKLNELTNYEDEMNQIVKAFKQKMDLSKRRMDSLNDILRGGNSAQDVEAENRDLRNMIPSCDGLIADKSMIGTSAGLLNVKQAMDSQSQKSGKSLVRSSADYLKNKRKYESDIDKLKARVFSEINSNGIDDWIGSFNMQDLSKGGLTLFRPATDAIFSRIRNMKVKRARIEKELKKPDLLGKDFSSPPFDKDFNSEIGKKINDTIIFERKKFIQDCVFDDPSKGGKGIGLSSIMNGIKQTNIEGGGTTVSQYKTALNRILTSDAFIQDKLERVKALEKTFGTVIQVIFKDAQGRRTSDSPYNLFKKSVENCNTFFKSDQSLSTQNKRMNSRKYRLEKAERYLNELKDLESNFITDISKEINDRVIECSGIDLDQSQCGEKMYPGGASFCLKHATSCALKTQTCYLETKNMITNTNKSLVNEADAYNNEIETATKQQQSFLNKINLFLKNSIAIPLKTFFPTTDFSLPEGLSLTMPELEASNYNVLLRGGGKLDFLEKDLPRKLTLLKLAIIKQAKQADKIAENYIKKFQENLIKAQESWDDVKNQCMEAISAFQKNQSEIKSKLSEKEAEKEKELREESNKVERVCRKFDKLRINPLGGCDGDFSAASLYKEATEISFFINDDVKILKDISGFENLCHLNQNESEQDTEKRKDDTPDLIKLCSAKGNDWNKVKKSLGFKTFNSLTENNPKLTSQQKEYIRSSLGLPGANEATNESLNETTVSNRINNILDISKSIFEAKPINFGEEKSNSPESDKENKHQNICIHLDDYLKRKARSVCKDKKSSGSTCIEEEYGNAQKNLGQYRTLNSLIGDLSLSVEYSKGSEFSRQWMNLGEEVDNPCVTQNESGREEKDLSDVMEENINEMINDLDTSIR